jgi:hypothetical protein
LFLVTQLECVVVGAAAVIGFFDPAFGSTIWAWTPAPFNARYLGTIYFATLAPLLAFGISGRWSPGRVVLPMIFTFTTAVAVVMIPYWHEFEWTRPGTYVYWILYLFIPINAAAYLYLLRSFPPADATATSPNRRTLVTVLPNRRTLVTVLALAFAVYGLALLAIPTIAASFWPWPIDAFDGRIYAAVFLAPAVGVWLLRKSGSSAEWKTVGVYLVVLGVLSIVTVIWTNSIVPLPKKVDYHDLGTWAFFTMNVITATVGMWMMRGSGSN